MIIQLIQKEFGQEPVFTIQKEPNQQSIADCTGRNHQYTYLSFFDGDAYQISFEPVIMEKNRETVHDYFLYVLSKNEHPYGSIRKRFCQQRKIFFLSTGYDYYELLFGKHTYMLYEIGLGEHMHYLCLYEESQLVAVIHKHMEVTSHLDSYTIYIEYPKFRDIACIATLFIDGIAYSHNNEIANSHIKEEFLSFNKELKAKFQPDFIHRVLQIEETLSEKSEQK